jgi:serine/threonine protein kinase/Cdc6-like AAA superfamily ATPase
VIQQGLRDFDGTERFRITRRLGQGGMGVVYEAFDRDKKIRVALKTLRNATADGLMRFKREFRAIADITHPNLVGLGELFEDQGNWFFTMELVTGVPFVEWVRPGWDPRLALQQRSTITAVQMPGVADDDTREVSDPIANAARAFPMREDRLRSALAQLVRGLSALHAAGKVHRDVKPSNVMVTSSGRVALLDFGVVSEVEGTPYVTEAQTIGTPAYMAPEQAAGVSIGPEADFYALGAMLYEALVGRPPFIGRVADIVRRKQELMPTSPRELAKDCPEDLAELCIELLSVDPMARPNAAAILERLDATEPASGAPTSPATVASHAAPFVGRSHELEQLHIALAEVRRSGAPIAVFVDGESGLGKTALVRRFCDQVSEREGVVVLAGRCYERESVPYKAVDGVVDAIARWMQRLPRAEATALVPQKAALLLQVFPVLRRVDVLTEAPRPIHAVVDPLELRTRVFLALRELLARLAERRPVVIAIDDLQWADPDSIALLSELVRAPEAPALLVISTWRAMHADDAVAVASRPSLPCETRDIRLTPLGTDESRDLVRMLVQHGGSETAALADAISREAQGHPMFIDELVRHAARGGAASAGTPARLEEALQARIDELDHGARRLLDLLAVAATPLEQEVAANALAMDLGTFGQHANLLRNAHLVRTNGTRGTDLVETYHDRVRAAAFERLRPEERLPLHHSLARALETSGGSDPEALATHLWAAGRIDDAAEHAGRAADQAMIALAFERAARLYRFAIDLNSEPATRARDWRIRLGEALAHTGRGSEAAHAFLAAVSGSTAADALDLKRRAAQQLLVSGHIAEGLETLKAVLESEGLSYPASPVRALAAVLWNRLRLTLRGLRFTPRDVSQVTGADLARIDVCWHVGLSLSTVDVIRGNAFQGRGLLLALAAGEPYRLALALAIEVGYVATTRPTGKKFDRTLRLAREIAATVENPHALALVNGGAGIAALLRGDFAEALRLCDDSEAVFREQCTGVSWELGTAKLFAARALLHMGNIAEIQRRVPAAIKEARERGDLFAETSLRATVMPFVLLASDAAAEAEQEAADALSRWHPHGFQVQHYYQLVSQVSVDLYRGEIAKALARLDESWPKIRRSLLLRVHFIRLTLLDLRARVAVAAARNGGKDEPRHHAQATVDARRLAKAGMPWVRPLAIALRAGTEARRAPDVAAQLLADAVRGFDEAGLALHAAAADRRRGRIIGGDEGRALVANGEEFMKSQRISNFDRWTDMLLPGF